MSETFRFFGAKDFRSILKHEYEQRRSRRRSYSWSAFARDIGFSAPRLAGVLKGNFGVSTSAADIITKRLGYSREESNFFADLVESQHGRTEKQRKEAALRLLRYKSERVDALLKNGDNELLEHWYILATRELIKIHSGKISIEQIAKRLGIKVSEAEIAVNTLLSHEQIRLEKNGFAFVRGFLTGTSPTPSTAVRRFHAQFLEKANSVIQKAPVLTKKNRSSFLCFDKSRIEEARTRIEEFHKEFTAEFASGARANRVYGFGLYLFPVDIENE